MPEYDNMFVEEILRSMQKGTDIRLELLIVRRVSQARGDVRRRSGILRKLASSLLDNLIIGVDTIPCPLDVKQYQSRVAVGLSFSAMVMLYSVMLVGVYITASHKGLSCLGWPLCPNGFGLPTEKYFFEHYHRLLVTITAGVIYLTAAYTSKNAHAAHKTAIIASVIVSAQILLGVIVVNTNLDPLLVAAHLSTGILLFAMVLLTLLTSYGLLRKSRESTTL